jgi:hypothetical protein
VPTVRGPVSVSIWPAWQASSSRISACGPAGVAALQRAGHSLGTAHAVFAAQPSPDHPSGRAVVTSSPARYRGTKVRVVPV